MHVARTDFSQYSHEQLVAMLAASKPATVNAAAESWDATGRWLHDQASELRRRLADIDGEWSGPAADQYRRMIGELADGLERVGAAAWAVRDAAYAAGDALGSAIAQMPVPQPVPQLPMGAMALASTQLCLDGLSPAQATQLIQQQTAAIAAVQSFEQAQAASVAAHTQAVQVMTSLADRYAAEGAALPAVPDAATGQVPSAGGAADAGPLARPHTVSELAQATLPRSNVGPQPGAQAPLDTQGAAAAPQLADGAQVTDPTLTDPLASPLFGTMFREGIAAAGGTFMLTRLPLLSRRQGDAAKPTTPDGTPAGTGPHTATAADSHAATAAAAAAAGAAARNALPHVGGGGGFGGGGFGGGGGAAPSVSAPPAPTAYAGFAGGGGMGGGAGVAGIGGSPAATFAGASGAIGGAGATGSTGGFMGGMPMGAGMAGMGADGAGRRLPPWLVETEDVWGESAAVAPTVIGEEL